MSAAPFGGSGSAEWSSPALGLATLAVGFLEPDPAVEWTSARLTAFRQNLKTLTLPDTVQ